MFRWPIDGPSSKSLRTEAGAGRAACPVRGPRPAHRGDSRKRHGHHSRRRPQGRRLDLYRLGSAEPVRAGEPRAHQARAARRAPARLHHQLPRTRVADPPHAHHWFAKVVRGVEDICREHGYSLLLGNTHDQAELQQRCLTLFRSHRVDGLLAFLAPGAEEQFVPLLKKGPPVVFVGRRPRRATTSGRPTGRRSRRAGPRSS